MVEPSPYFTDQTVDAIHARMLAEVDPTVGRGVGTQIWNATRGAAVVLRMAGADLRNFHARSWASTATGSDLDERVAQAGVIRRAAIAAGAQTPNPNIAGITGAPGTVIPALSVFSTSSTVDTPGVRFLSPAGAAAVIGGGGSLALAVVAEAGGIAGNIPAGALAVMASPIAGVTGVTNALPFVGGIDTEDDEALRARYLLKVQSPSAGGNIADYQNWALEVPGVGGVSVIPHRDGGGTVSVAIIGADNLPASQAIVDATQTYISPPLIITQQAETAPVVKAGAGVTIDATRGDDTGDSIKMQQNAAVGTLRWTNPQTLFVDPISAELLAGVYELRMRVLVDAAIAGADILDAGIYNTSTVAWAVTRPGGATPAHVLYDGIDLPAAFAERIIDFYWNGADALEIRIDRLNSVPARTVWIDQLVIRSKFGMPTGQGKAPVNHWATVEAAGAKTVALTYDADYAPGYVQADVDDAIEAAYQAYIASIAFAPDNDVKIARVGGVILDVPGVNDYNAGTITLNDGSGPVTANIVIGAQQVAIPGVVTPL